MIHAIISIITLVIFLITFAFGIKNNQEIVVDIFTFHINTKTTSLIFATFIAGFVLSWCISYIYIIKLRLTIIKNNYQLKNK